MHRSSSRPQGRKELLLWLNGLCNSEYPAVESLRDGAAYCTIVEAAVNRIAKNLDEAVAPEAATARDKAAQAAGALNRLNWTATAVACENLDPSLDSVAVRKACRENMTVLQEMLRSCVPREHMQTIDVERLATGKLQDHMWLLQWLYQFMNKALMQYSRAALEKRSTQHSGEVEGVKLNRAQMLLEQKRKANMKTGNVQKAQRPSAPASTVTTVQGNTGGSTSAPNRGGENSTFPRHHVGPENMPVAAAAAHSPPQQVPQLTTPSSTDYSNTEGNELTVATDVAGGFSYARVPMVIPASMKSMLANARREVEDLEVVAMETHEDHLARLTRPPSLHAPEAEGQNQPQLPIAERLLSERRRDAAESPSLQELGELLEERDALVRVFSAVDGIVREYHARGVPSRLLADLCEILYP